MAGLSLIEMMIALVMALIVAAGIISVFASTSSSNKVQQQMAALQEEGRFAIHSLRDDLGNANGTYCSNSGGNADATTSGLYLDALRAPIMYAKANLAPAGATASVLPDNTIALPAPTQAYVLPSSLFMRGYDCTKTGCTPADPNTAVPAIPAMGKLPGNRVVGTDVLTLRYLKPGAGWAITSAAAGGSFVATTGGTTTITLQPLSGEPQANTFTGNLALLADCSNAEVFAVAPGGGNTFTVTGANYTSNPPTQGTALRVFNFNSDFQTVTYFLQVVCANGNSTCPGGPTTGELVRRVNGTSQPLVRGVERLDFLYGIIDADANTEYLTATQVDAGTDASGNPLACPPQMPPLPGITADPMAGCLWRAVQTVQVSILMDGQTPLYTLTPNEMYYLYSPDGGSTPTPPSAHPIKPNADQGFPNQLLRREFTTLVALRNFNP